MKNLLLILIWMIGMHIFVDFHLQGFLASSKQKLWWIKQENYNVKYEHDWIPCLLAHCAEWTIFIMIPVIFYVNFHINSIFIIIFIINVIIHFIVDNLKCNKMKLSLIEDQLFHIGQILLTWIILCY